MRITKVVENVQLVRWPNLAIGAKMPAGSTSERFLTSGVANLLEDVSRRRPRVDQDTIEIKYLQEIQVRPRESWRCLIGLLGY
jgi:hypothetical protein